MRVGGRSFLLRLLFAHLGARAAQRDIVKPVETDVPLHAPGCAGLWPAFVDMRMESSG
jgi:hypothetical protein